MWNYLMNLVSKKNPETMEKTESSSKTGNSARTKESLSNSSDSDTSNDNVNQEEVLCSKLMGSLKIKEKILSETSIDGIVKYMKEHPGLKIITMVGAGISTAAGIPDFRSPGTGIYHNLQKYKLPYTDAIFELQYFMSHPEPFYHLAGEIFPAGAYRPTKTHYFIKLLQEKGLLLRHYTQNIDNLDRTVGITEEKLIEAHGTFNTSHCLKCKNLFDLEWLQEKIKIKTIPKCSKCGGLVKPDIVFFGEQLPQKFYMNLATDFKSCDLLIIMGSSLVVQPFASLVSRVKSTCPRLLINGSDTSANLEFQFDDPENGRDVFWLGDCDEGSQILADKLGWGKYLNDLMKDEKGAAQT